MTGGHITDRFTHDIVTFMRSWAPYGGPPADEVLSEFGLTREQLVQRYQHFLEAEAARREQERLQPWLALHRNAVRGSAQPSQRPTSAR